MSKKSIPLERPQRVPVQHLTVELYETVIDDTVSRVKGEFVQEGVNECVKTSRTIARIYRNGKNKTIA